VFFHTGAVVESSHAGRRQELWKATMADDLDDMLLEAAGRSKGATGSSRRAPAKRRGGGHAIDSSDEDRSDSKSFEDDFDDDDDEEDDYEQGGGGGGRSSSRGKAAANGSKMPLKKRLESTSDKEGEEEDEGGRDDGYESELSFGSDLYKGEEDRNRLNALTELQREMVLHDRAEARDNYKMRVKAGQRHKQMQVKTTSAPRERDVGPPSSRMRSSMRESRDIPRTAKDNALNELVARRNKTQDPDYQRGKIRRGDVSASSAAREREKEASLRSSRKRSYSDSESESDASEESSRDGDRSDREGSDDDDRKDEPEAGVDDIKSITIRRSKLAKWFMEPFFEEVVVGCFVRIGIGVSNSGQSIYRVCQVKNVDARDPNKQYTFENRHTYKYLNCVWGDENSAARWQMVRASDQAPTEKEIRDMEREVDRCGGRKLSKAYVEKKREALAKVNSFVYNAATVKQMLQEKKLATTRPSNIALEKDRITKELGVAEERGDIGEVERLQARLRELEEFSVQINKSKDAKALALAEMNRRNRFENFKNASDVKPVNTDAKAGEAGYDPFSRRWTRSQNYYKSDAPKVEKENEETLPEFAPALAVPTAPVSQKNMGNRVVPEYGAEMFALHDFDLPINLGLLKQPGCTPTQAAQMAYMARKQAQEATYGPQVDSSDGRRHTLTLTVNDYKRRRGLL
jgi:RNA polymerase-associated protein RTF1